MARKNSANGCSTAICHVIATDAHDTHHRPPTLSAARDYIAENYDDQLARALVEDNPQAIVNGQVLPFFQSLPVPDNTKVHVRSYMTSRNLLERGSHFAK